MTAPLVRRFGVNTAGRDLLVGDIHGHFTKLQNALDAVAFSPAAGDRLFSVGDLVDRGPESALVLDWLVRPWFYAVAGNHDTMAVMFDRGELDARLYAQNGGAWLMGASQAKRSDFASELARLPVAIELQTASGMVGIVHAECPRKTWPEFVAALEDPAKGQLERESLIAAAQWSRGRINIGWGDDVPGVRAVVVGHTPVQRVTSLGNVIYIDTGAWLPGDRARPFTLLDATTLRPAERPSELQW